MTERTDHTNANDLPWRAAMPWLVAAGVYALLMLLGDRLLNDPDSYWHLVVGRWIVEHRGVPYVDPFSHTAHGQHWIAFEWLSELAYAGAFSLAGWPGVAVLAAAAIALAFGLLTHFLLRELDITPTLVLVLSALVLASPHMLARPHALVMPVMVAWVAALVRAMDRNASPPYAALPLLILWANLHGSVSLAIGLIGPAILEPLLQSERSEWRKIILQWLPFVALALLAACITPYGPRVLLIPLTTFGLGDALNTIMEWRPQDFGHLGSFEILLLLAILMLSRGMTLPLVRVLVVLGLLHLALSQSRHADLLAMLAPLFLAQPLARQFNRPRDGAGPVPARTVMAGAIVAMVAMTGLTLARSLAPDPNNTPRAAIAAADLRNAGPVFNEYAFGGYLIYAGIAPFIDGRGELYGARLITRHHRAVMLHDIPDFLKLLDEYRIGATLLVPATPAVAFLDRLPEWQRVYADDVAVVHKRRAGPPAQ